MLIVGCYLMECWRWGWFVLFGSYDWGSGKFGHTAFKLYKILEICLKSGNIALKFLKFVWNSTKMTIIPATLHKNSTKLTENLAT